MIIIKKVRIFITFLMISCLLVSCLLVSCGSNNINKQTNSSNTKIASNIIECVEGYAIDEVAIAFSANDVQVKDPNKKDTIAEQIQPLNSWNGSKIGKYNDLKGNFTYICVAVSSKTGIDVDYIPIMILQAFHKNEIDLDSSYIRGVLKNSNKTQKVV